VTVISRKGKNCGKAASNPNKDRGSNSVWKKKTDQTTSRLKEKGTEKRGESGGGPPGKTCRGRGPGVSVHRVTFKTPLKPGTAGKHRGYLEK